MKKIMEDKRILFMYIFVFVFLGLGITYALENGTLALNINTALIRVDESAYGDTTFNMDDLELRPILDSAVETSTDNVIKIEFKVGGASSNTADNIIYDIALNDLQVSCELLSPYMKWKLLKNGTEISNGSLDYKFDTIKDGRLVLTTIQQDLPQYSSSQTGYDDYVFYMWMSDSCQTDLSTCVSNNQVIDQSNLLRKVLMGKIEVELYTESKKELVRKPSSTLNTNTCMSETRLLSEMSVGSYVKYVGNNGCEGKACEGQNANYVSDSNMGYCNSSSYKFNVNGWKIGYIENGSAHLISAGAPECVATYSDSTTSFNDLNILHGQYCYGTGYTFDSSTGKYKLTGVSYNLLDYGYSSDMFWIENQFKYTCLSSAFDIDSSCTVLYEILDAGSSLGYKHTATYETTNGTPMHLNNLNEKANSYCNSKYIKNGICDGTTAWAMNSTDFKKIMGGSTLTSCTGVSNVTSCGANILSIDNGGLYWFADYTESFKTFFWFPAARSVRNEVSNNSYGLRPVLSLDPDVIVIGGSGIYADPYIIAN